ncbi:uncharacterized protein UBRO_20264 [Ustilago bromivora]|uniref:Uncharacterized protein n=1 Tax=Ustilago bromivora TaxID=307758 RepID=A0A1K0H0A0_9BASI|nr:uncharacterized protein UBRO_20264 [Ustilago bromivora]
MEHLKGVYNVNHPKWSRSFDGALTNAVHGTINTIGEYNVNYLLLGIIREYLTFHQVWGKIKNGLGNEAIRTSHRLALITQLGDVKMFNADARKLIQEVRAIQAEGSILGRPFADDTLFSVLQKCTIHHPVYRQTVTTVHQLSFDALTTTLSARQSVLESVPSQKFDPQQASARIASSDNQGEATQEANTNNSGKDTRTGNRPQRI